MIKFEERTPEEIKKVREYTILEMLNRDIQRMQEAINHHYGLIGTAESLVPGGSPTIRSVVEEIIKDEEAHWIKLVALRKKVFGV